MNYMTTCVNRGVHTLQKNKTLSFITKWLGVAFGAFLYAFGFYAFISAANITTGGVTGFVNVINMITPVKMSALLLCINIPLLIISWFVLKWKFTISTLFGALCESFFLSIFETHLNPYLPFTENILLTCLVGGVIMGCGLGLVMKCGSSTGGTDIVMKLLHRKWRYLSGGVLHICIDTAVLIFFFCVTRNFDATIYGIITVIISNTVYDLVLYGKNTSKTVHIITEKPTEMTQELMEKCECGVTVLEAKGAYTNKPKKILLCVVRGNMFPILKDIIQACDESAFVIVSQSSEIYGNGYQNYHDVL